MAVHIAPLPATLLANQNAFLALQNNPLLFLSNHAVTCSVGAGAATVLNQACGFSLTPAGNDLRIGLNVSAIHYPNRTLVSALLSQTRGSSGGAVATRFNAAPRFADNAADLWITDQQSGCTVIALDWGGNQYSMFHLLPHDNADFGYLSSAAFYVNHMARSAIKNYYLRSDATQVVNASMVGVAQPLQYIMLQSQHNARRGQYMQTIGVSRNGTWEFYRQILGFNGLHFNVIDAEFAPWRPWSEFLYHDL